MKIAVPSTFPTVDACVGTQLCCSQYLLVVDLGTMEYEVMPNPLMALSGPAAGKFFAQQLLELGVSKILADNCNFNIRKPLAQVGIQIIDGVSGPVDSAIRQFREVCMADTIIMPVESIQE